MKRPKKEKRYCFMIFLYHLKSLFYLYSEAQGTILPRPEICCKIILAIFDEKFYKNKLCSMLISVSSHSVKFLINN